MLTRYVVSPVVDLEIVSAQVFLCRFFALQHPYSTLYKGNHFVFTGKHTDAAA